MRTKLIFFISLLLLFLSINAQEKEPALIYFYYDNLPEEMYTELEKYKPKLKIFVDEQLVYQLGHNKALQYKKYISGKITISFNKMAEKTLEVEGGKTYFLSFNYFKPPGKWKIINGDSTNFFQRYSAEKIIQVKEDDIYTPPVGEKPEKLEEDPARANNYAVINFIAHGYGNMKLYLNNIFVTAFGVNEIVRYKIHSRGRISVTITSESDTYRKEGWVEVKENKTYYYSGNTAEKVGVTIYDNEEISKRVFLEAKSMIQKKKGFSYKELELEEGMNRPIGKIPENIAPGGTGQGSGFLLNNEGYIITNHHVIDKVKNITVKGIGGDFYTAHLAEVVASDPNNDLAIIKLLNPNLKFTDPPYNIKTGTAETGESIYVLGYPKAYVMGEEVKLTTGVISAISGIEGNIGRYQISAPIQPGNSGGPLFDNKGNVIGVVNSKYMKADNASYAIKTPLLQAFIILTGKPIPMTETNIIESLPLNEQIKQIKNYIYIIECDY